MYGDTKLIPTAALRLLCGLIAHTRRHARIPQRTGVFGVCFRPISSSIRKSVNVGESSDCSWCHEQTASCCCCCQWSPGPTQTWTLFPHLFRLHTNLVLSSSSAIKRQLYIFQLALPSSLDPLAHIARTLQRRFCGTIVCFHPANPPPI